MYVQRTLVVDNAGEIGIDGKTAPVPGAPVGHKFKTISNFLITGIFIFKNLPVVEPGCQHTFYPASGGFVKRFDRNEIQAGFIIQGKQQLPGHVGVLPGPDFYPYVFSARRYQFFADEHFSRSKSSTGYFHAVPLPPNGTAQPSCGIPGFSVSEKGLDPDLKRFSGKSQLLVVKIQPYRIGMKTPHPSDCSRIHKETTCPGYCDQKYSQAFHGNQFLNN
jgi:hypothetical protein